MQRIEMCAIRLAPREFVYSCFMTASTSLSLRTLGNSDLQLTPIGFGAWAIGGGGWKFGWGSQDDNESMGAAIHRAWPRDLGINWIDTAAVYGLGHSEEVVAQRALKTSPHKPYIFTKCERLWHETMEPSTALSRSGNIDERARGLVAPAASRNHRFSIRSTGPIPMKKLKSQWRRWRNCASKARFAGSASQFLRRPNEARAEDRA